MSLARNQSSAIQKKIGTKSGNSQKLARLKKFPQMLGSDHILPLRKFKKITPRFLMLKTQLEASGFMVDLVLEKVLKPVQTIQMPIQRWLINGGMDIKINNLLS